MSERFSDAARRVIATAQTEAARLRHNYIGTEHLLLGLLVDDSDAREALAASGVTHAEVRARAPPAGPAGRGRRSGRADPP